MAKKCLPTPARGLFIQNPSYPANYDLTPETGANFPFSSFRMSLPHSRFLAVQGAVFVAESHKNGAKVLSTGLRPTAIKTIFVGDHLDAITKKKSLLIFWLRPTVKGYEVFFFDGYYPKSVNRVLKQIAGL